MTKTYNKLHKTGQYSQQSWIIWPVCLNGWVVVYELSGCGFKSSCSHLNFRFRACFEQGVPWHSGNYRVWIHSKTRRWHDKNIQWNPYFWCCTRKKVSLRACGKPCKIILSYWDIIVDMNVNEFRKLQFI